MSSSPTPLPDGYPDALPPIELRPWTRDTYRTAFALKVREDQSGFVADNVGSLAQAYFHEEARPLGCYAGDLAVGFVMLSLEDVDKGVVWVWRLMIGADHQGKGFGRQTIAAVIEHVRQVEGAERIHLSHSQKPGHPGPFYESLGFTYTGEEEHEELIMSRDLTPLEA